MSRVQLAFGLLVLGQVAHSTEEYLGRIWETFPPARYVTLLVSPDPATGFLVVNLGIALFGIWCLLWPVRLGWRSAVPLAWLWIAVELINGVGHPLWTVWQATYTPGVMTALLLLLLALNLARQVTRRPPA